MNENEIIKLLADNGFKKNKTVRYHTRLFIRANVSGSPYESEAVLKKLLQDNGESINNIGHDDASKQVWVYINKEYDDLAPATEPPKQKIVPADIKEEKSEIAETEPIN